MDRPMFTGQLQPDPETLSKIMDDQVIDKETSDEKHTKSCDYLMSKHNWIIAVYPSDREEILRWGTSLAKIQKSNPASFMPNRSKLVLHSRIKSIEVSATRKAVLSLYSGRRIDVARTRIDQAQELGKQLGILK